MVGKAHEQGRSERQHRTRQAIRRCELALECWPRAVQQEVRRARVTTDDELGARRRASRAGASGARADQRARRVVAARPRTPQECRGDGGDER